MTKSNSPVGAGSAWAAACVVAWALALVLAGAAGAANPTTMSINCSPKGISPGTASACVVTVTDSGPIASRVPPTGTVTFTVQGSVTSTVQGTGTFDPDNTCALEPSGAFSSKCT